MQRFYLGNRNYQIQILRRQLNRFVRFAEEFAADKGTPCIVYRNYCKITLLLFPNQRQLAGTKLFKQDLEHELGLTAFEIMPQAIGMRNPDAPLKDRIYPRVTQWLRAFMDAQCVLTDSFHGCAFAILFLFVTVWMCIKHPDDEKGLVEMPSTYTSAYESVY